jgi:hypothetical protein
MSESSRGAEFRQAVDVLLREQRAFEDERAQWEYERVELLNKCVQVISQWLCMPAPLFAFEHFDLHALPKLLDSDDQTRLDCSI